MPIEKPLLVIPSDFVESLLSLMANESDDGHKNIVAIIHAAEDKYNAPIKSWIKGWIVQYTRTRVEEIKQSVGFIERNQDAHKRFVEFKDLISRGAWNIDSFNYILFIELIKAVPGYKPLDPKDAADFIATLKDLLLVRINDFLLTYQEQQKVIELREANIQTIHRKPQPVVHEASVHYYLDTAKEYAQNQKDKTVFCLLNDSSKWKLLLLGAAGETYALTPSEELLAILGKKSIPDVEHASEATLNLIKNECMKSKALFLVRLQLFIEDMSNVSAEQLKMMPIKKAPNSSFVLGYLEDKWTLWWVNSMGRSNEITLEQYPQLNDWLGNHRAPLDENNEAQLKVYLLNVNTQKAIVVSKKVSAVLDNLFTKLQSSDTSKKQNNIAEVPAKEVNVGKLDLGQFKALNSLLGNRAAPQPVVSVTVTGASAVKVAVEPSVEAVASPEQLPAEDISAHAALSLFLMKRQKQQIDLERKLAEAMEPMNPTKTM
ncbi:MAG: hypothetical protein P4L65_01985 [Legionella sp.]|nr:hypothetical protein [Legionella sp.]